MAPHQVRVDRVRARPELLGRDKVLGGSGRARPMHPQLPLPRPAPPLPQCHWLPDPSRARMRRACGYGCPMYLWSISQLSNTHGSHIACCRKSWRWSGACGCPGACPSWAGGGLHSGLGPSPSIPQLRRHGRASTLPKTRSSEGRGGAAAPVCLPLSQGREWGCLSVQMQCPSSSCQGLGH